MPNLWQKIQIDPIRTKAIAFQRNLEHHRYPSDIAAPVKSAHYIGALPYVTNECNI